MNKRSLCLLVILDGWGIRTETEGHAEQMISDSGEIHTSHTMNPVPFILADDFRKNVRLKRGVLGNIAPTILSLMGIEKPEEMTEESLIMK